MFLNAKLFFNVIIVCQNVKLFRMVYETIRMQIMLIMLKYGHIPTINDLE